MRPASTPAGALTAVTASLGDSGAKSSKPKAVTASRVALAIRECLSKTFSKVSSRIVSNTSLSPTMSDTAGVYAFWFFLAEASSFFEIEIKPRKSCLFDKIPSLGAHRGKGQSRRQHNRLLGTCNHDVQAPGILSGYLKNPYARYGIHHQEWSPGYLLTISPISLMG